MGEQTRTTGRLVAAVTAAVGVAALLSSCAGLAGAAPDGSPTSAAPTPSSAAPTSTPSPAATEPLVAVTPIIASPSPSASRAAVAPFITSFTFSKSSGHLDVGALVPNTVESDGTCTLTAEHDGVVKTAKGDGVAASSYTGCPQLVLDGLTAGSWTVTVSYASDESAGTSKARTVTAG